MPVARPKWPATRGWVTSVPARVSISLGPSGPEPGAGCGAGAVVGMGIARSTGREVVRHDAGAAPSGDGGKAPLRPGAFVKEPRQGGVSSCCAGGRSVDQGLMDNTSYTTILRLNACLMQCAQVIPSRN